MKKQTNRDSFLFDEPVVDRGIYSEGVREELLDTGHLTCEEDGFMKGYEEGWC